MSTSSSFKGVHWSSRRSKWFAVMRTDGQSIHLGYFKYEVQAARAYDAARLRHHGPCAVTNVALGLLPPLPKRVDDVVTSNAPTPSLGDYLNLATEIIETGDIVLLQEHGWAAVKLLQALKAASFKVSDPVEFLAGFEQLIPGHTITDVTNSLLEMLTA